MYVLTSGGIHTLVPNQWCPEVLSEDVTWKEIYLTFTDLFVFIKAHVGSITGVFFCLSSLRSISQTLGVANHGTHATPAQRSWKLSITCCLR